MFAPYAVAAARASATCHLRLFSFSAGGFYAGSRQQLCAQRRCAKLRSRSGDASFRYAFGPARRALHAPCVAAAQPREVRFFPQVFRFPRVFISAVYKTALTESLSRELVLAFGSRALQRRWARAKRTHAHFLGGFQLRTSALNSFALRCKIARAPLLSSAYDDSGSPLAFLFPEWREARS